MSGISVLIGLLVAVTIVAADYCNLSCGSKHTMCQYPKPGPSPKCQGYVDRKLTQSEKDLILKRHNELRNLVAEGSQPNQPSASNMRQLVWDDELATVAQRWADQCLKGHDKCRISERFSVGQNIASYRTTGKLDVPKSLERMIQNWFKEVNNMPSSQVDKFTNKGSGAIGHYTQMVWATTERVGCGFIQTSEGGKNGAKIVCNYGEAGNWLGSRIYNTGKKCSECPANTKCSTIYTALCN